MGKIVLKKGSFMVKTEGNQSYTYYDGIREGLWERWLECL